jgi:hypothetical protein
VSQIYVLPSKLRHTVKPVLERHAGVFFECLPGVPFYYRMPVYFSNAQLSLFYSIISTSASSPTEISSSLRPQILGSVKAYRNVAGNK